MSGAQTATAINSGFAMPPLAMESAEPKPGTALVVYRPNDVQVATKIMQVCDTFDTRLAPICKKKEVKVHTDDWQIPASICVGWLGGAVTAFLWGADILPGIIPALTFAGGNVLAIAGTLLRPFERRRAIAKAPHLLQGDLRGEVLALADARRSFASADGVKCEAPELDLFVAAKAKRLLAAAKDDRWNKCDDPDLLGILERLSNLTTKVSESEQELLDFMEKLISGLGSHYAGDEIPRAFAALPEARQKQLAGFVRDQVFDADRLKGRVQGHAQPFLELHRTIERLSPKLEVPFATKPENLPAPVADHQDLIRTLTNLALFQEKTTIGKEVANARQGGFEPQVIADGVAFAIDKERTGVERVLIGKHVERLVKELDQNSVYAFRVRAAFADLLATAEAEPDAVKTEAEAILRDVDVLARGRQNIREVISVLELSKRLKA